MKEGVALVRVVKELRVAQKKHRPMVSAHEGYAVIKEEMCELWGNIRKLRSVKDKTRNAALRHEAAQVAAMGLRFMVDLL